MGDSIIVRDIVFTIQENGVVAHSKDFNLWLANINDTWCVVNEDPNYMTRYALSDECADFIRVNTRDQTSHRIFGTDAKFEECT